ncbi:MAG TPA: DUF4430 domain-containing protein [Candidatus Poseidoniales archaeon]|nr:DUF4430 domain-containing protein [Candidatus Poseidoniales archaeon]
MTKSGVSLLAAVFLMAAASGCIGRSGNPTSLSPNEKGEIPVTLSLDFKDRVSNVTHLGPRLVNGTITFDPLMVEEGLTAYRVMEAVQIRENFSLGVTYYVGMGPFIHTIDGVSGNQTAYWAFKMNGVDATVGPDSLTIVEETEFSWVLESVESYEG